MNKKLVLLGAAMLMTAGVASAQKRVTGRVLDSDGQPLIGATVRVDGVKKVTMTDENGNFTLTDVPASAKTLQVSYIGYQAQNVSIASNMKVVMKDNNILDEAVVIGYGSARKIGTVVGSVSKIGGETLSKVPTTNVGDAMQGQVAGMQVLNSTGDAGAIGGASITIRGTGSLNAGTAPLIVVDGTPVGPEMLSLINPSDIESYTTLKDASATSIYGSRAANGVIYIQTKKGKTGDRDAEVTVSQKLGWGQLARRIGNPMNSTELLNFQLENGIINLDAYKRYKAHGANTNWQDYLFRNDAPMYETNVSVRGGSEKISYFLSGSYYDNTGVDDLSKMKKYSVRSNIDARVNDWLKIGFNQGITYTDRKTNRGTGNGANSLGSYSNMAVMGAPYWDPMHKNAAIDHKVLFFDQYDLKYLNSLQPFKVNDLVYAGTAYVQLNPIEGLTLKSQLGLFATNSNNKQSDLTELPDNTPGVAGTFRNDSRDAQWTITNTAEYHFSPAKNHDVTLLVGQEGIKYNYDRFYVGAEGTRDNRMLLLSNMSLQYVNSIGESTSSNQFLSFFGRADYGFKNKWFANFTVRNDRSSRFGKKNRSAMFYSGGIMWNMKSEKFLQDVYWLDDLDVRASVGSTGNAAIGDYESLALVGNTHYNGMQGWGFAQPANEELGWEKQIQTNVGFGATIYNRVNVDFNFYHRKTKDMLMDVPLPYTTGFATQRMNVGELSNRGVELSLKYDIIKTKELYLSVRGNYAYNKNKIDKLYYGLKEWEMPDYGLLYKVGSSLNYYMPIFAGVDQNTGEPMWYKKGHKGDAGHTFNPETMTKDGSNIANLMQDTGIQQEAPHTGGFGLTASWKGLTLSADFAFVLDKYMINLIHRWGTDKFTLQNGFNADRDMLNVWKKPGDKTEFQAFKYPNLQIPDTRDLENSSFLRMKNLTLAYALPDKWMKATHLLKGATFSFTGRNLFTVTKYKGADPEIGANVAYGGYPATREFVLGVELKF